MVWREVQGIFKEGKLLVPKKLIEITWKDGGERCLIWLNEGTKRVRKDVGEERRITWQGINIDCNFSPKHLSYIECRVFFNPRAHHGIRRGQLCHQPGRHTAAGAQQNGRLINSCQDILWTNVKAASTISDQFVLTRYCISPTVKILTHNTHWVDLMTIHEISLLLSSPCLTFAHSQVSPWIRSLRWVPAQQSIILNPHPTSLINVLSKRFFVTYLTNLFRYSFERSSRSQPAGASPPQQERIPTNSAAWPRPVQR